MKIHNVNILATQEWGAEKPHGKIKRCKASIIVIHHMATPNPPHHISKRSSKILAKECQRWHRARGWKDTGQHFTIACDGTIMEGRTGSIDAMMDMQCVQGGHCVRHNNDWGIEMEGTHSIVQITEAQAKSLAELCALLCLYSDIQSKDIYGHRDYNRTDCPGDMLYSFLPELRKRVHGKKLEML